jgi:poly-gamma-glutamate synthesis protein (capsule biosynthesis protein)
MIFLGDIAVPSGVTPQLPKRCPGGIFVDAVANLEGGLSKDRSHEKVVYNDAAVGKYLKALDVRLVSLANNHVLDTDAQPSVTTRFLASLGIQSCGAGESLQSASREVHIDASGHDVIFMAFGWNVIGCRPASGNTPGANPMQAGLLLARTRSLRADHPDAKIVLLMHWNYEMEPHPQPMHRQLAFAAIDAGADAIVGAHPHCVGGIEVYRGAPVVYSLGNWFVPHGVFWDGRLLFPESTRLQLAFEWHPLSNAMTCHWFEYQPGSHDLQYLASESLTESERIRELTPYSGMTHRDYISWFASNRKQRHGLPIYRTCYDRANWLRDSYVSWRQILVDLTFRMRRRKGKPMEP